MKFIPKRSHPDIKSLYEYWRTISPASRLPGRQHFDPLDVPKLLPRLMLIDVLRKPLCFRYRLVGSKIEEFAGENLTGRRFAHRLTGSYLRRAEDNLKSVVDLKRPSWRRGKPLIRWEKDYVELERLYLPLAADGETVDMVLAITVHSRRPYAEYSDVESRVYQSPARIRASGRDFVRRKIWNLIPKPILAAT